MSGGRPRDPIWEFFSERQDKFLWENKAECITCKKGDEIGFHNEDASF